MEALREWHDFYLLIGTASATLVGLMFVAASIGATYFTAEREAGLRAFLTPTVLHFAAILVTCLIVTVPMPGRASLAALLLAGACIGVAYSANVWLHMRRRGFTATIDRADRLWYAASPVTSYVLIAVAAILLLLRLPAGARPARGSAGADMTVWMMLRAPSK